MTGARRPWWPDAAGWGWIVLNHALLLWALPRVLLLGDSSKYIRYAFLAARNPAASMSPKMPVGAQYVWHALVHGCRTEAAAVAVLHLFALAAQAALYAAAVRLWPARRAPRWIVLGALCVFQALPEYMHVVGCDGLLACLCCFSIYLAAAATADARAWPCAAAAAIAAAAIGLKSGALGAVPVLFVFLWFPAFRGRPRRQLALAAGIVLMAGAASWWFGRQRLLHNGHFALSGQAGPQLLGIAARWVPLDRAAPGTAADRIRPELEAIQRRVAWRPGDIDFAIYDADGPVKALLRELPSLDWYEHDHACREIAMSGIRHRPGAFVLRMLRAAAGAMVMFNPSEIHTHDYRRDAQERLDELMRELDPADRPARFFAPPATGPAAERTRRFLRAWRWPTWALESTALNVLLPVVLLALPWCARLVPRRERPLLAYLLGGMAAALAGMVAFSFPTPRYAVTTMPAVIFTGALLGGCIGRGRPGAAGGGAPRPCSDTPSTSAPCGR